MKKFLSSLLLCTSLASAAQESSFLPQVFSPDAAELGKYGRIPVNYFNGLPDISIPLTELRAKNFTLPVYLSYHASGNRPEHHPGWVGQGWSLHAGGCINRIIRGRKDEMSRAEYENDYGIPVPEHPGYLFHQEESQTADWSDTTRLWHETDPISYKDHEPDEFQVNLPGIQASFYFAGNDRVAIVSKSDADFTVSYALKNNDFYWNGAQAVPSVYDGFFAKTYDNIYEIILTNKDGTRYYFGGDENAIEYSLRHRAIYSGDGAQGSMSDNWDLYATANTWMLTKIVRPDGEEIYFGYKRDGIPMVITDSHYYEMLTPGQHPVHMTNTFDSGLNRNITFLLASYLNSVSCKSGADGLYFHSGRSRQLEYGCTDADVVLQIGRFITLDTLKKRDYYLQLDSISTNRGVICMEYSNNLNTRLKLNSVSLKGDGCDPQRFRMTYNSTPLPEYNSRKTDLWGYYYTSEAYQIFPWESLYLRRSSVNDQLLQAEMLTELDYPTGGWTLFEYEPHDYSKRATQFPFALESAAGQSGGLRIKSITDYASSGQAEVRRFSYSSGGVSTGIISGIPILFASGNQYVRMYYAYRYIPDSFLFKIVDYDLFYRFFSERTLNQLSDTDGNHVTYSMVTETVPGNGHTVYEYYNHDSLEMACSDQEPALVAETLTDKLIYNPFTSKALSRGLLKSKKVFDEENDERLIEEFEYSQDTSQYIKTVSVYRSAYTDFARVSYNWIYTYHPAITRKMVTSCPDDGGTPHTEVTEFSYNSHRQVVSSVRSDGLHREQTFTSHSGDLPPVGVYGRMQRSGLLSSPVEQTMLHDGAVIASTLTTWKEIDSLFVPSRYYEAQFQVPCDSALWQPYNGYFNSWHNSVYGEPRLSLDSYGSYGNILSASAAGGQIYRYFWTQNGLHPEASFTGLLMPTRNIQVEDVAVQEKVFQGEYLTQYCFDFESERTGQFSFGIIFNEGRGYNLSGTMDGDTVFNYVCPSREVLTPASTLYQGEVGAGPHTFRVTLSADQTFPSAPGSAAFIPYLEGKAFISYPALKNETIAEPLPVWFEADEEQGSRFIAEDIPQTIPYTIDWWQRAQNGEWKYRSNAFSGSMIIGADSVATRRVRIYPSDAAATDWDWTSNGELESVCDARGLKESYGYDALGRLTTVRDSEGALKESYSYHNMEQNLQTLFGSVAKQRYTAPDASSSRESVQYYDGLGRPWQKFYIDAGKPIFGEATHIVEKTDYDSAGRVFRTWLPFRAPSRGPLLASIPEGLYSDSEPYSLTDYDGSPLNRPLVEYGPGEAWHSNGKAVRHEFLTNDSTPALQCVQYDIQWTADTIAVISRRAPYQEGGLTVNSVTNEDGLSLLTFTDLYGQTLLERRRSASGENLDTYYLYDALGRLSAVLPPALSATSEPNASNINKYAYLYRHDAHGNCIAKKLPGCAWTFMAYDARGVLVLSQDAVQRKSGRWSILLSDAQGRPCISGTCSEEVDAFDTALTQNAVYARCAEGYGTVYGYRLYMIEPQDLIVNQINRWSAFGLTGRQDRILGPASGGRFLQTLYSYDSRGRLCESVAGTHLGGTETERTQYSFTDEIVSRTLIHSNAGEDSFSERYDYAYDNWGRLLSVDHTFEDRPVVRLHDNTYDGLGRLDLDRRNGNASLHTTFRQNVRSLLTGIDCGPIGRTFHEALYYESPSNDAESLWSGGISRMDWRQGSDSTSRTYSFGYDAWGRLTSAAYQGNPTSNAHDALYSYDPNGNITCITHGLSGMDFSLNGNQIRRRDTFELAADSGDVVDPDLPIDPDPGIAGPLSLNPTLPALPRPTVFYDACGRMIKDADNHISNIEYNNLHLPSRVSFSGTVAAPTPLPYGMQYAADGRKLRTGRLAPAVIELNMVSPRSLDISELEENFDAPTDYVGNLIYKNGILDKILIDGGYISAADTAYHFFVTDHLGSVRVVTDPAGTVEHEYHYYPYGTPLEEAAGAQASSDDNPFRWAGKHWDEIMNAYDFGARYYSTLDARWNTMDPLCEKYYSISPYAYCAGNPVNLVDPTGKDVWEINYEGRIIRRITDTTQDAFYMVNKNKDGEYERTFTLDKNGEKVYNSLVFGYRTIESQHSTTFLAEEGDVDVYDVYRVRDDDKGSKLFEFLSNNVTMASGVEIGHAMTGIGGLTGLNFVTTSHQKGKEYGLSLLFNSQLVNGYFIRSFTHSHLHSDRPSPYDEKARDIINNIFKKREWRQPAFYIYRPISNQYFPY